MAKGHEFLGQNQWETEGLIPYFLFHSFETLSDSIVMPIYYKFSCWLTTKLCPLWRISKQNEEEVEEEEEEIEDDSAWVCSYAGVGTAGLSIFILLSHFNKFLFFFFLPGRLALLQSEFKLIQTDSDFSNMNKLELSLSTRPITISRVLRAFSDGPTDRPTNRQTNRPTNQQSGL